MSCVEQGQRILFEWTSAVNGAPGVALIGRFDYYVVVSSLRCAERAVGQQSLLSVQESYGEMLPLRVWKRRSPQHGCGDMQGEHKHKMYQIK